MTISKRRPLHTSWDEVISAADQLDRDDIVFFERPPDGGTTPCLIFDGQDLPEELDVPSEALALGYASCLNSEEIQDVIHNARLQVSDPDRPTIYRAIRYYFDNDAFVELGDHDTSANAQTNPGATDS